MNLALQPMDFALKNDGFCTENDGSFTQMRRRQANYLKFLRQCEGLAGSTKTKLEQQQAELDEAISELRLFDALLVEVNKARGDRGQPSVPQDVQEKLDLVRGLPERLGIAAVAVGDVADSDDEGAAGGGAPGTPQAGVATPSRGGGVFSSVFGQGKKEEKYKAIGVSGDGFDSLEDVEIHELVVKIHGVVRDRLVNLNKARCKWEQLVDDALEMGDNVKNMGDRHIRSWRFISDLHTPLEFAWLQEARVRLLYIWRVFVKPPLLKVCAVLASALSVVLLIGAASTMPYSLSLEYTGTGDAFHLSPVSLLISIPSAASARNMMRYVILIYFAFCCIYSLFKLKIPSMYELYVGATDEYTPQEILTTILTIRILTTILTIGTR